MSGNSFGNNFVLSTFGESHGVAIGGVVDGCPPGLELCADDIQIDLDRRKPGQSKFTTQRKESDRVEILSGVFEGKTTGTPIGLIIYNEDARARDYENIKNNFRPGHADYTYQKKYGRRDYRGGGRSSARETAIRVAAGAIARKFLYQHHRIVIRACVDQIGSISIPCVNWDEVNRNMFFIGDESYDTQQKIESLITEIRRAGDSIGAGVYVEAIGVPAGFGEPVFDRLDADIAKAMISINAAKGVEIGAGFSVIEKRGSDNRDEIVKTGFTSNHAGGVLGGISSGQPITARVAFKPTSSILIPGKTINVNSEEVMIKTTGRHDPCVGIRAVPIVEAMMAIVIMDHYIRDCGQTQSINVYR